MSVNSGHAVCTWLELFSGQLPISPKAAVPVDQLESSNVVCSKPAPPPYATSRYFQPGDRNGMIVRVTVALCACASVASASSPAVAGAAIAAPRATAGARLSERDKTARAIGAATERVSPTAMSPSPAPGCAKSDNTSPIDAASRWRCGTPLPPRRELAALAEGASGAWTEPAVAQTCPDRPVSPLSRATNRLPPNAQAILPLLWHAPQWPPARVLIVPPARRVAEKS